MQSSDKMLLNASSSLQHISRQVLERFSEPLDCLTAHLMLECPEVLAGVKPANLISIVNRTRPCGRNLYQLWQTHHAELETRIANLNFIVLKNRPQALLLLCYNSDHLERHLAHAGIRALLRRAGYEEGASCEALAAELCHRINKNDEFPHEIGLFIGYPAKDVAAFMGLVNLPFACQGPWKIYGNPVRSLALAEQYRCCRQRMSHILATGNRGLLDLNNSHHPFFCTPIESDYQYHDNKGLRA
jgi:hypothetical protein